MASFHHFAQPTSRFESPAKVFAKLKSKVQREELYENEVASTIALNESPIRDKHGAISKSRRKKSESTWITDDQRENHWSGPYRNEAQGFTLSPIPSPQKTYSYPDRIAQPAEDLSHISGSGHGFRLRQKDLLEAEDVSYPLCNYNRAQIHTKPPQRKHTDGFQVTSSKMHKREQDCTRRSTSEEESACVDVFKSPALLFSPMRSRLRKRKIELQEFNSVSDSSDQAMDLHSNTSQEDVSDDGALIDAQPQEKEITYEAAPARYTPVTRCNGIFERNPMMSPAKVFASMRERERKTKQQEVHEVSSRTTDPLNGDNSHPSRDMPPPPVAARSIWNQAVRSAPGNIFPVDQTLTESTGSQSETEDSDDPIDSAEPPRPVLEDPHVLNTPRVSIPKKQQAVFKRNKWPQTAKFPSESVIHLRKWFLRKNHKGLFVEGIHRDKNIPWNSNIIVERISRSVLKTVSGKVYILVGRMNFEGPSGFPAWFLKKFVRGFPAAWKELYEKFLLENTGKTMDTEERDIKGRNKSESSSIDMSMKQKSQKPLNTPASCPPGPSSSMHVSRSGRTIKPPLEYWKGGRVILDANMNVTIHECYETSICIPELPARVSARASKKSAFVLLPCAEGEGQSKSTSGQEAPVPLRRVKTQQRKSSKSKDIPKQRPSYSPETPVETQSSPDTGSARATRSSRKYPDTARGPSVETVSKRINKPERSSLKRAKKRTSETRTSPVTVSRSLGLESPSDTDESQSSGNEVLFRRSKRVKEVHNKQPRKVPSKSRHSSRVLSSPLSESSVESPQELRKSSRVTKTKTAEKIEIKPKHNKPQKTSPPTKPAPKATQPQPSKKPKVSKSKKVKQQEEDEDKWTEEELMKLQEVVSYYPKHLADYWAKVARKVGTRSAEECFSQHTQKENSLFSAKKPSKSRNKKVEAPNDLVTGQPVISARAGTLKWKKQVRNFLENMPSEDMDDAFSATYMQKERNEIPSRCPNDDHDFTLTNMEPVTPEVKHFYEVKTPQCLHITPGMMGSPSERYDDKYAFQLQNRIKGNQFDVYKHASSSKNFTPTPTVKRPMKRCVNTESDTFVVWEMFPGKDGMLSDSGEEKDFYFSDND